MIRLIENLKYSLSLCLAGLVLLFSSCGCDEDCAEFSNFRVCDNNPTEAGCDDNQIVFEQDADFLTISVEIKNGEPNDLLTYTLFVEDSGNFLEAFTRTVALKDIDEDVDGSERKIRAAVGVSRREGDLWPVANYKYEIELSQENIPLNATQNFSVQ